MPASRKPRRKAARRGAIDSLALGARKVMAPVRDLAMFLIDRHGRIASWNEGVRVILGWEEADWVGQDLSVAFTPEDVQAGVHVHEMTRAAETGRADDDRWMQRRNGERFFALGAMTSVQDDGGRLCGYLKVLRDFTAAQQAAAERERLLASQEQARRWAESQAAVLARKGRDLDRVLGALHERDAELRVLLEQVRDYAIFTLNPQGIITSWNQGAALIKGYTAQQAIGMRFARLFTPADRARGRPAHEMEVAARTGEYKGDGRRMRKGGGTFHAAVVLTALRGRQGELLGFLKLTQDISERRRTEAEREKLLRASQAARAGLERLNLSKAEFLATVSHELRTPLSAILGWSHVLERGVFDPETVRHGLAAISRNARTQAQLIEDLLDMNRIESGQLRLEPQRVELSGVVAAAIDAALPAATAKGIGLRTLLGPAAGVVMGDAARLQQVVSNLLNNAIKFTPAGGQVSVSLQQAGDEVQIAVSDTGQGIEQAFLARLFDRFQQQDATTTRRHGGLGIGLAIVRHLVELHGGAVRADSPGRGLGAVFTVTLPALPVPGVDTAPSTASAAGGPRPGPVRLDGVTVLLVDDEPDLRAVTTRVLQDAGARVLSAADADQGLALLRSEKPAVILSDIGMPSVSGYDLMRRVRELPSEEGGCTPAAALTAYARPEDRRHAIDAGYQMHLAKPVSPGTLVGAVARLAGQGPQAPASL